MQCRDQFSYLHLFALFVDKNQTLEDQKIEDFHYIVFLQYEGGCYSGPVPRQVFRGELQIYVVFSVHQKNQWSNREVLIYRDRPVAARMGERRVCRMERNHNKKSYKGCYFLRGC